MTDADRILKEAEKRNRQAKRTILAADALIVIFILLTILAYLDKIVLFVRYVQSWLS